MGFNQLFFICFFIFSLMMVSGSGKENSILLKDRASLVSFMADVQYPENSLDGWKNSSGLHICKWSGIKCNNFSTQVILVDLSGRKLQGTISPVLANISSLRVLDLSNNFFSGRIPLEFGNLSQLKQLSLSSNLLNGKIPMELGCLHQLVYLDLGNNNLIGEIPEPIFFNGSSNLQYIDFSNNSLTGRIPLMNLKDLKFLLLWSNKLVGEVPISFSNSTKLKWLDLESNMLTGELPSEIIQEMFDLQFLYLSYNNFVSHGENTNLVPFFASLVNLSGFQELELAGNGVAGEIPSIIGDLSTSFEQIHLDDNFLYGSIPSQISKLVNLTYLNLSNNLLNGSIPSTLSNMDKLERLYLSNNELSGNISADFSEIPHLGLLDLSKNKLSGSIPDSVGNISQLRKLLLYENQLTGTIPPSLGKCINLEILDLSGNMITGTIPHEVAGLRSLKLYLNLSRNHLHGDFPLQLSKMDMVLAIDLSLNNISGIIPSQMGDCVALEYLNVSGNLLEGNVPSSIGQLPYLQALDLSSNGFIGEIPHSLLASSTITQLNFSFNNFSGKILSTVLSLTIDSFLGNEGLCGSINGMSHCQKKRYIHWLILPILLTPILFVCGYPVLRRSKMQAQIRDLNKANIEEEDSKYPRVSYQELIEATNGFSSSSLVGSGRFGHVYKGILGDNTRIAVKVLDSRNSCMEISTSFKRECQVLRKTRHRNLMRIITTCSRPDFKALVLPLMENGSLEDHLYPTDGLKPGLDLVQMISLCHDVAEGLAYLHHHSPIKVVHCDLKPSNILLDDDMTALIADFGIAKFIQNGDETNDSVSVSSVDGLLCGSLGYIAPEYGMGRQASTHGDVYSYGVVLLEIVTGKRPTEVLYEQGSNLHEYVKLQFPYNLESIIHQAYVRYAPPVMATNHNRLLWCKVISEIIELGLICTGRNPSTRPTMVDIAHEMGRLKLSLSTLPEPSSASDANTTSKPSVS